MNTKYLTVHMYHTTTSVVKQNWYAKWNKKLRYITYIIEIKGSNYTCMVKFKDFIYFRFIIACLRQTSDMWIAYIIKVIGSDP